MAHPRPGARPPWPAPDRCSSGKGSTGSGPDLRHGRTGRCRSWRRTRSRLEDAVEGPGAGHKVGARSPSGSERWRRDGSPSHLSRIVRSDGSGCLCAVAQATHVSSSPAFSSSRLRTRSRGVKNRSRTRPTWFSTWPCARPDAGCRAVPWAPWVQAQGTAVRPGSGCISARQAAVVRPLLPVKTASTAVFARRRTVHWGPCPPRCRGCRACRRP